MILDWLNAHATLAVALSTLVTALATVVIAVASAINWSIFRLQKKVERASRMPILVFTEKQINSNGGVRSELYVKNVGYGPALNVVRCILDSEHLGPAIGEPLPLGSLAPSERVFAFAATASMIFILDDPAFHAVVECDDLPGGSYKFEYKNRTHLSLKHIGAREIPSTQANRI